jgi:hypothetical protein
MKSTTFVVALALIAVPGFAGPKDEPAVPQYDTKTEAVFDGNVTKAFEVDGVVHITLQTKAETLDIYLAPASFVNLLEIPVREGLKEIEVIGSKVKFKGDELVLARMLKIGKTDYALRDAKGEPNWMWMTRRAPTGE